VEERINVIKTTEIPVISSRDVILLFKNMVKQLSKDVDRVIINFEGIEFISRSAADELVKFKETAKKDVVYTGLENNLATFLRSVAANKVYRINGEQPKPERRELAELL